MRRWASRITRRIHWATSRTFSATLKAGETFGVVESVKAASDLYAPVGGTVIEVNSALDSAPETENTAPYSDGWMLKLKVDNAADADRLMDADTYGKQLS